MTAERVPAGRLFRVGMLAAVFSVIANSVVDAVVSSLFGPVVIPPDEAVTLGQVMAASVAGAAGTAVLFAVIDRFTWRPMRVFWGITAVGLLLSFRLPWRASRDHLRGRWLLCTWWPRPPTSAYLRHWPVRGKSRC